MGIANINWRGPRPFEPEDRARLIGRGRELGELYARCETFGSYDVIEITAPSGVGKTSFVSAGAIPMFEEDGRRVLRMKSQPMRSPSPVKPMSWANALRVHDAAEEHGSGKDDVRLLYALAIGQSSAEAGKPSEELLREVAEDEETVVILDQVEELLRYRRTLGTALLRTVGLVARDTRIPHIVIARSEYMDALRPVEVPNIAVWNLRLDPIEDERSIRQIIVGPTGDAGVTVDDAALDLIVDWWHDARTSRLETDFAEAALAPGEVGLLHVHALLWSLTQWAEVAAPDASRLSPTVLADFAASRGCAEPNTAGTGGFLVSDSITRYVSQSIEEVGRSSIVRWANGPRLLMARAAPHLSSAGYKISQALSSLIPLALREEINPVQARAMPTRARAIRREHFAEQHTSESDKEERFIEHLAQEFEIPGAGIAANWRGAEVTAEMIQCLIRCLEGMTAANVLRVFEPGDDPIYELVHDGFGVALNRWAVNEVLSQPASVIGVIADRPGQTMSHSLSPGTFLEAEEIAPYWGSVEAREEDGRRVAVVRKLRWTGNEVSDCTLEDLVFEDSDFRGSVFFNVKFRNVVFRRCNLRGVAILGGCEFDGVRFFNAAADGAAADPEALNTLTIRNVRATSVRFEYLQNTRGLVLERIIGGTWRFEEARISHLVIITAEKPVRLEFVHSSIEHITLEPGGKVEVVPSGDTDFQFYRNDHGLLP